MLRNKQEALESNLEKKSLNSHVTHMIVQTTATIAVKSVHKNKASEGNDSLRSILLKRKRRLIREERRQPIRAADLILPTQQNECLSQTGISEDQENTIYSTFEQFQAEYDHRNSNSNLSYSKFKMTNIKHHKQICTNESLSQNDITYDQYLESLMDEQEYYELLDKHYLESASVKNAPKKKKKSPSTIEKLETIRIQFQKNDPKKAILASLNKNKELAPPKQMIPPLFATTNMPTSQNFPQYQQQDLILQDQGPEYLQKKNAFLEGCNTILDRVGWEALDDDLDKMEREIRHSSGKQDSILCQLNHHKKVTIQDKKFEKAFRSLHRTLNQLKADDGQNHFTILFERLQLEDTLLRKESTILQANRIQIATPINESLLIDKRKNQQILEFFLNDNTFMMDKANAGKDPTMSVPIQLPKGNELQIQQQPQQQQQNQQSQQQQLQFLQPLIIHSGKLPLPTAQQKFPQMNNQQQQQGLPQQVNAQFGNSEVQNQQQVGSFNHHKFAYQTPFQQSNQSGQNLLASTQFDPQQNNYHHYQKFFQNQLKSINNNSNNNITNNNNNNNNNSNNNNNILSQSVDPAHAQQSDPISINESANLNVARPVQQQTNLIDNQPEGMIVGQVNQMTQLQQQQMNLLPQQPSQQQFQMLFNNSGAQIPAPYLNQQMQQFYHPQGLSCFPFNTGTQNMNFVSYNPFGNATTLPYAPTMFATAATSALQNSQQMPAQWAFQMAAAAASGNPQQNNFNQIATSGSAGFSTQQFVQPIANMYDSSKNNNTTNTDAMNQQKQSTFFNTQMQNNICKTFMQPFGIVPNSLANQNSQQQMQSQPVQQLNNICSDEAQTPQLLQNNIAMNSATMQTAIATNQQQLLQQQQQNPTTPQNMYYFQLMQSSAAAAAAQMQQNPYQFMMFPQQILPNNLATDSAVRFNNGGNNNNINSNATNNNGAAQNIPNLITQYAILNPTLF